MITKEFRGIERIPGGYLIETNSARVQVIFMTDDIIRIRTAFSGTFAECSYALVTTAWPDQLDELLASERRRIEPLAIPFEEHEEYLEFRTQSLRLRLIKHPFAFKIFNKDNKLLHEDLAFKSYEKDHMGRLRHYAKIDYAKDFFYGFGEQNGPLEKSGRHMHLCPRDAIGQRGESGGPTYKHIPFYLKYSEEAGQCAGFFYNNSHDAVFDMGNERSGYWDSYCYYETDGGDIDLFFINGPQAADCVRRYAFLTGTQAMPTKQSLGFMLTTMYYGELEKDCDRVILNVLDELAAQGIPADTFGLPSGYATGAEDRLRYVFTWNRKRFPDPRAFFAELAKRGIDPLPNTKPGILPKHPALGDFEQAGAFVRTAEGDADYVGRWWGGPGKFVDFTKPAARDVWQKLLTESLLDFGVHSVWNDNCEYDGVEDRLARCCKEGLGGDMRELKPIQANMMAYTVTRALQEKYPGERPYILTRAGFSGIQRYAQSWGGDNASSWECLKYNVAMILGMGLCACSNYGADIGGFQGAAPDEELLLRWIQNGIFQIRFCMNSANSDNTVTLPTMYEAIMPQVREAFKIRYRLLPYLYSLMYESQQSGLPAWRPLFMEFPDDPESYKDASLTFMLGPSILVANVLEKGAQSRRLYLPAGTAWYDLGDQLKEYPGGQTLELPVDRSSVPMFLRGDSIVPFSEDIKRAAAEPRHLKLLIAARQGSRFTYFNDDGRSEAYKNGGYEKYCISTQGDKQLRISFKRSGHYLSALETLQLEVVSKKRGAYWVKLNDAYLPQYLTPASFAQAEAGWMYEMNSRKVLVKMKKPAGDFVVVVSFEAFDLIGMENNG